MVYTKVDIDLVLHHYLNRYNEMNGGIDGCYEKTILEVDVCEIQEDSVVGCFTIHKERELTSLIVYPKHKQHYQKIFTYLYKIENV